MSSSSHQWTLLSIVGLVTVLYLAGRVLSFVSLYARPSKLGRYLHSSTDEHGKTKEPWALVTGASDGIGRQLVAELAAHGFNVVVHGRNHAKLATVEAQLEQEFLTRQFRILVADLGTVPCANCFAAKAPAAAGSVDFDSIVAQLQDLHLTVVINNGGGPPKPTFGLLDVYSHRAIAATMSLNALFPLHLLARLMPLMARNGPALVINIGSLADMGLPMQPIYGPSKTFMMSLTSCVGLDGYFQGQEDRKRIEMLCVRVGSTAETRTARAQVGPFTPNARTMARAILARVGCGSSVVVPYFRQGLQAAIVEGLPEFIRVSAFVNVTKGLLVQYSDEKKSE